MKMLNISKTAAIRVLLRGLAAAGSAVSPAVAPKPIVPTVETTTAPHSAACSLSCKERTVSHTRKGPGSEEEGKKKHLEVEVGENGEQDQT